MSDAKSAFPAMSSSEDGVYQVYAMRYARNLTRRVFDNFLNRDMIRDVHDGPVPVDYHVWIIRNAHRTVLVDTGFGARAAAERGRQLDVDPIEALGRLGIDADTLEDVILTHLHFDHAGNLGRFGRARLHVQDAEVAYATGRCMCESQLRHPFDIEDVAALIRKIFAERVCFHDGDAAPLPGISLHVLPGHSKGMQAVRVMTPRGPILLASDVTHHYANLLRRAPFRITIDFVATLRSYAELMRLGGSVDRIIPGHDPKVRALYPTYNFGGIDLAALHEEPKSYDIADLARSGNV
jgi:glyoxylase-like metal-dependent hydrolase (beta-lactamase superfamily II)